MTQTIKTQKTADIRYRTELKNRDIVIYTVRSSDDTKDYHVTLCHGIVNNCDCPATVKNCYHAVAVQAREDSRKPVATSAPAVKRDTSTLNGSSQGFSLLKR